MKFLVFLLFVFWVICIITNPFVWLYLSNEGPPFISELGWMTRHYGDGPSYFNIRAFLGFALSEIAIIGVGFIGLVSLDK
jgi:hypothetical protein